MEKPDVKAELPPPSAPQLPSESGKFRPAHSKMPDGEEFDLNTLSDVETCKGCHAGIAEEWSDSVHALASMSNPFYRVAFEDFVAKSGRDKAGFCGGCHDPALLFDDGIKRPLVPNSKQDHTGVSCGTCHGIQETTTDGNGSYTLTTTPIPVPVEGDDESLKRHIKRVVTPALATNELCVSCHRGFMSPETGHEVIVAGLDEWGPFRGSAYNGNPTGRISEVKTTTCVGCHMPTVGEGDEVHASHRFAGGHSTLAAMTGSSAQVAAVEAMVKGAATIDIPGIKTPDTLTEGGKVSYDVVVFNENTGHHFPGGAMDLRDTWIETELLDADGIRLGGAGLEHEKTGADQSAYVLQAYMATKEGSRVTAHSVHDFRTAVFNHTIAPRDAAVIRYTWTVGKSAPKLPLKAVARLRHRRLTRSFSDATCKHVKLDSDKPFARAALEIRGFGGDPCAEQPIIEIGQAEQTTDGKTNDFKALYNRALGLQHHVQESLQEALDAFDDAQKVAETDQEKGMAAFEKGRVVARMGRTQDAMDLFSQAEKLVGPHTAIHFARGRAFHRVFQFEEAVKWYTEASKLTDDDRIWRQLAIAAGSISDSATSYDAAQRGLKIEPRDPHLLRNQMLALNKLDVSDEWREKAKKAFQGFKRDELAPDIRDRCSAANEECKEGRLPIQEIGLQ